MRDIRTDLKERLSAAERRRAAISAELKRISAEVDALMRLLEIEEAKQSKDSDSRPPAVSLADFIVEMTKKDPQSKADLKDHVEVFGYDWGGRAIHAALLSLLRSGRVLEVTPGKYLSNTDATGQSAKTNPSHRVLSNRGGSND